MFRRGFNELALPEAIQRLVPDGGLPARRCAAVLQIDLRDLPIHGWLVRRLGLGVEPALGVGAVARQF